MANYQDEYIFKAEADVARAISQIEQWLTVLDEARQRAGRPFPQQTVLTQPPGLGAYPTNEAVRSSANYQAQVNQTFRNGIEVQRQFLDVQRTFDAQTKQTHIKTLGDTIQYMNRWGQVTKEVNRAYVDLGDNLTRTQISETVNQEALLGARTHPYMIEEEINRRTGIARRTNVITQERFSETGQRIAPQMLERQEVYTKTPGKLSAALGAQERELGRLTTQYEYLANGMVKTSTVMDGMTKSTEGVTNRVARHVQIVAEAIITYEAFRRVGQVATEWVQAHREMDWAIAQFSVNVDASSEKIREYLDIVGKMAYATGTARPEVFETAALATRLQRPELARPATEIEMMWGMQSTDAVRDLFAIQQQFPGRDIEQIMNVLMRNVRAGSLGGADVLDISETWGAFSKQFKLDLEDISALFVALGTILGETGNPLETFMRHLERFYTDPALRSLTEQYTKTPTVTYSATSGEEIRRPMLDILRDVATMTTPAQQLEIAQFMPQELGQKSRQFFNTMLDQWTAMEDIMTRATKSAYTWGEAVARVSDTAEIAARRVGVAWQNALAEFGNTDFIKGILNDIAAGLEAVAMRNATRNRLNWTDRPTERETGQPSRTYEQSQRLSDINKELRESIALALRQGGMDPWRADAESWVQLGRVSRNTYSGTVLGPTGMNESQWMDYRIKLAEEFIKSPEFNWQDSGEELGLAFAEFIVSHGPAIAEAVMGRPEGLIQQGYGSFASTQIREAGIATPPTPSYPPEMIPGTQQWRWGGPYRGEIAEPGIARPLQLIMEQIRISQTAAERTGTVIGKAKEYGVDLPTNMVRAYEDLVVALQDARDAISGVDPDKPEQANRLLVEASNKVNEVVSLAAEVSEMQRNFLTSREAGTLQQGVYATMMGGRMSTVEEGGQSLDMAEIQARLYTASASMEYASSLIQSAALKFSYGADEKAVIPQEVIDFYGDEQAAIDAVIGEYNVLNEEIQASATAHGVARVAQQQAVIFVDEFGRVIGTGTAELGALEVALGSVKDASLAAAATLLGLAEVTVPEGMSLFEWSAYYTGAVQDIETAARRAGKETGLEPEESRFVGGKGEVLGVLNVDPNAARIANLRANEDLRIQKEQLSQADRLAKEAQSEADRRHKEAIGVMQGIIAAIPGVTSPTPVTGADLFWRSVTGTYEDKFDEPVRRARAEVNNIIKGRPHEYELPGDLFTPELLGFAKGQETEQKTAILQDTLAEYERQFYGGMRPPEEYDKDTFIANAMKVIQEKQQAKQTQAMYMSWLEEAGLGPDSKMILGLMDEAPLVTALTGGKAPAEVQQQLAEYVALDSEQIQTTGVTDAFMDTFKDFNWVNIIDSSIRASIDNDKETLVTVGKVLGMVLADGASAGFVSHIVSLIWAKLAKEMTQ